jgi:three-Cys-motif partner protein
MTIPKDTIWPIERHTVVKHQILKNYLQAWFPILSKYKSRIIYLDGYSGPGRYSKGEPGSPIVALKVASEHRARLTGEIVFFFIDEDKDRIDNLRQEVAKLDLPKNFETYIEHGEFGKVIGNAIAELEKNDKNLAPTFAFIDPFGFSGLPFNLVSRILKFSSSEVLINFMVDSINRFIEHPEEKTREHIVQLFGAAEVSNILTSSGNRVWALRDLYQKQLRTTATFVRFFEMADEHDRTIYYLFFASNNALGHQKMKEAMWRVDSEGDFRFSDSTDPNQTTLFRADHTESLLNRLVKRFGSSSLDVSIIRRYVLDETEFIEKHMGDSLRFGEDNGTLVVKTQKVDGSKRKKRTFPDGAIVTFN